MRGYQHMRASERARSRSPRRVACVCRRRRRRDTLRRLPGEKPGEPRGWRGAACTIAARRDATRRTHARIPSDIAPWHATIAYLNNGPAIISSRFIWTGCDARGGCNSGGEADRHDYLEIATTIRRH